MESYPEPEDPSGRPHNRQVYTALTHGWFDKHHDKPWFQGYLMYGHRGRWSHWYDRINNDYRRWRALQERRSEWNNEQRYAMYQDRDRYRDWRER